MTEILNHFFGKLCEVDWKSVSDRNVSLFTENFHKILDEIYQSCFPLTTKLISKKRISKPWFSAKIFNLVKLKSRNFRLYRLGLISREENNIVKNRLNSIIRSEKRRYFHKVFSDSVSNMKKTWKT